MSNKLGCFYIQPKKILINGTNQLSRNWPNSVISLKISVSYLELSTFYLKMFAYNRICKSQIVAKLIKCLCQFKDPKVIYLSTGLNLICQMQSFVINLGLEKPLNQNKNLGFYCPPEWCGRQRGLFLLETCQLICHKT